MQIIEKDQLPKILPVKGGRDSSLRIMLLQLEVGQALFMPTAEWKRKKPPYNIVAGVKRTHKRTFEYGIKGDGSGWLFRRLT